MRTIRVDIADLYNALTWDESTSMERPALYLDTQTGKVKWVFETDEAARLLCGADVADENRSLRIDVDRAAAGRFVTLESERTPHTHKGAANVARRIEAIREELRWRGIEMITE